MGVLAVGIDVGRGHGRFGVDGRVLWAQNYKAFQMGTRDLGKKPEG